MTRNREIVPMPQNLTVILIAKVGEPLSNSRTSVGTIEFVQDMSEGLGVLLARATNFVSQVSNTYRERNANHRDRPTLESIDGLYLKPTTNANQSQYVRLEEATFAPTCEHVWTTAQQRRGGEAQFKLELFVYCRRVSHNPQTQTRAAQGRIDAAVAQIRSVSRAHEDRIGEAEEQYLATILARQAG